MNTEQSYVGGGDNATTPTQAAQNEGQTTSTVDNRQPSTESPCTATVKLPLCIWEGNESGCLSEVDLVYWALDRSKHSYLEKLSSNYEGSEDFAEADYCLNKIQEIQNTLFDSVSELASRLSKAVNGMSHA